MSAQIAVTVVGLVVGFAFAAYIRHRARVAMRDRFAAAALQGMLADTRVDGPPRAIADNAYRVADAMLTARSAK